MSKKSLYTGDTQFLGFINQYRVYNRLLSAAEISQLYNYQKKNYE